MLQKAQLNGHRLPILLLAPEKQQNEIINSLFHSYDKVIIINAQSTLKPNEIIGHEYELILVSVDESLEPNLVTSLAGTLKRGGIMVFFFSPYSENSSPFLDYFVRKLKERSDFFKIEDLDGSMHLSLPNNTISNDVLPNLSQQLLAVEMIKSVVTGHRNRPLVILADRGRGKSAAIGIAIGELILKRTMNILVTAPSLAATNVVFKHISQITSAKNSTRGKIVYENSIVAFIAPDDLVMQQSLPKKVDLLVVDEAAGHNPAFLSRMLNNHSRIVFSTTVHGYEGSGYGFLTHFKNTLDLKTPSWKSIELTQPIRWSNNDPLEAFIDNTFLLSTTSDMVALDDQFVIGELTFKIFDRTAILENHSLLVSIYPLLKSAHYKTSPNDLRQIMNADDALIFSTFYNEKLVAVAITINEGKLDQDLTEEIYSGNRRPKGQLLSQSLVAHLGLKDASQFSCLRVMRIAVHPSLQKLGIGSKLIEKITDYCSDNNYDYLGCSFGATPPLMRFWMNLKFNTLRIGYKKNKFSGCNAALMFRPISNLAYKQCCDAKNIFSDNFICQLGHSLRDLDPALVSLILDKTGSETTNGKLDKLILDDLQSYAYHNRSYDDIIFSVIEFVKFVIVTRSNWSKVPPQFSTIIILRVLQNREWSEICQLLNLEGKKKGIALLKCGLKYLLENR